MRRDIPDDVDDGDPSCPWNAPDAPPCGCPACEWTGDEDDLEPVPTDYPLAEGEPDPAGMCPMCGHPVWEETMREAWAW